MQLDIKILLVYLFPLIMWAISVCFILENQHVTNTIQLFLTNSNKYAIVVCFLSVLMSMHSYLVVCFGSHIGWLVALISYEFLASAARNAY